MNNSSSLRASTSAWFSELLTFTVFPFFSRDELKQDNMRHEYQAKYPDVFYKLKFYNTTACSFIFLTNVISLISVAWITSSTALYIWVPSLNCFLMNNSS